MLEGFAHLRHLQLIYLKYENYRKNMEFLKNSFITFQIFNNVNASF